jgi:hypothetical protein
MKKGMSCAMRAIRLAHRPAIRGNDIIAVRSFCHNRARVMAAAPH